MSFFNQEIKWKNYESRIVFFKELIKDKEVLHYGCADWPIFNINSNLHNQLLSFNKNIDGYDIDKETIEKMKTLKEFEGKNLYSEKFQKKYDLVIAPETIEHVFSVGEFLKELTDYSDLILVTGPNAFCPEHYNRNISTPEKFIEIVHPDHKCWYSPYTLKASVELSMKHYNIPCEILEVGTLEKQTMVYCLFKVN